MARVIQEEIAGKQIWINSGVETGRNGDGDREACVIKAASLEMPKYKLTL